MLILERYTIKSVLASFFYCLFTFIFLYVIIDVFGHLEEILKNRPSLETLFDYYAAFIPIIFVQTAPVAMLLATVYAFGSMNKHNEITAMKASGVSLLKIIRPFLFMGALMSLLVMFLNESVVPASTMTTRIIKEDRIEGSDPRKSDKKLIKDVAIFGSRNRLFYIKEFNALKRRMEEVIILEHDAFNNLTSKIAAKAGQWSGGKWTFYNCITYNLDKYGDIVAKPLYSPKKLMDISETPRDFYRGRFQAENLTFSELAEYIKKLKDVDEKIARRFSVDLYYKTSFPFITFVVVLIGAAFGLRTRRAGALWGAGTSMAVAFVYYTLTAVSIALGKGGWLNPIVSAWAANAAFLVVGIVLLAKLAR